jgi:hypothetical protein
MPQIPTGMPAADTSQYLPLRSPTYDRDDSYAAGDEPPGPIGPIGYDVQE